MAEHLITKRPEIFLLFAFHGEEQFAAVGIYEVCRIVMAILGTRFVNYHVPSIFLRIPGKQTTKPLRSPATASTDGHSNSCRFPQPSRHRPARAPSRAAHWHRLSFYPLKISNVTKGDRRVPA